MLLSSPQFETFLARLYTDPGFLDLFLNEPSRAFQRVPLSSVEMAALLNIDNVGLKMAAVSFTKKRAKKEAGRCRHSWVERFKSRWHDIWLKIFQ